MRIVRRPGEPIGQLCRRLKKQLDKAGVTKEMRKREHYVKPCEERRRKKLAKQRAAANPKPTHQNSPE